MLAQWTLPYFPSGLFRLYNNTGLLLSRGFSWGQAAGHRDGGVSMWQQAQGTYRAGKQAQQTDIIQNTYHLRWRNKNRSQNILKTINTNFQKPKVVDFLKLL